jgi:cytoskeletal protein CcmA (bactofilin family)
MTTIPRAITITGTIHADEAMTIAGTVTGDVHASNADITVETGARIDGSVTGRTITVRGHSRGRLIARELVWLHETASVKGDVAAPRIVLEDGAFFNGSVEPARTDAALIVAAYRGKTETPVAS